MFSLTSTRSGSGARLRAVVALLSAIATPPLLIFGLAAVLVPGVPLRAGSLAFWFILILAGLTAAALVHSRSRLSLGGAVAIGAASGVLFIAALLALVNLLPSVAGSI